MQTLLLIRRSHTQISREGTSWERRLTPLGASQAQTVFLGALGRELVPDLALVSPNRRGNQTPAPMQEAMLAAGCPALKTPEWSGGYSNGDPKTALAFLETLNAAAVAVIGHEPFLSELVLQATLPSSRSAWPKRCLTVLGPLSVFANAGCTYQRGKGDIGQSLTPIITGEPC